MTELGEYRGCIPRHRSQLPASMTHGLGAKSPVAKRYPRSDDHKSRQQASESQTLTKISAILPSRSMPAPESESSRTATNQTMKLKSDFREPV